MKKKPKDDVVVTILNDVLTAELTAINQYFMHAELCQHWGYERLYKFTRKQSIDEMKHAERILERILYLDGIPNMQRMGKVSIGETVKEQIQLDFALEKEAVDRLTQGIKTIAERGDHGSRMLLEDILVSEEEHMDFLEAQLDLMDQVSEQNYLAMQIIPE